MRDCEIRPRHSEHEIDAFWPLAVCQSRLNNDKQDAKLNTRQISLEKYGKFPYRLNLSQHGATLPTAAAPKCISTFHRSETRSVNDDSAVCCTIVDDCTKTNCFLGVRRRKEAANVVFHAAARCACEEVGNANKWRTKQILTERIEFHFISIGFFALGEPPSAVQFSYHLQRLNV